MSIQDIIEGKKEWRAHMARVKALPQDGAEHGGRGTLSVCSRNLHTSE